MSEQTTTPPVPSMDGRMRTAIGTVLVLGGISTVFAGLGWGARPALSVGAGAAIAAANLYALARILHALLMPHSTPSTAGADADANADGSVSGGDSEPRRSSVAGWAVLAVLKMTILFGGMWLLMLRGYVEALPLLVGYGSLPLGIAVASIVSDRTGRARS